MLKPADVVENPVTGERATRPLHCAPRGRRYREAFRTPGPGLLYDASLAVAAPLGRLLRSVSA